MNTPHTDGMEEEHLTEEECLAEKKHIQGKKTRRLWFAASIVFVLVILLVVFQMVIVPRIEKKIIEEQIAVYMEEIKNGYLTEMDYDIPVEICSEITSSWNPAFQSMADYVLGGEEELRQAWKDIMKYMEYSVDSIEKDDNGNYIIYMTFTNRNLARIFSETAEEIEAQKKEWLLDALSGNVRERFWECFREKRDAMEDTVSKSIQFQIIKDEDENWSLDTGDLGLEVFAAMAGLEDEYLEMQ